MNQKGKNDVSIKTLSNLYLIVLFAGYSFYTSVLSFTITNVSESRGLTLPYRIFELLLIAILFIYTLRRNPYSGTSIRVLWLFWAMILGRFFYDLAVYGDYLPNGWKIDTFSYMVPMTLLPMLVVQKIYGKINFDKVLFWVYALLSIAVVMSFVNNPAMLYSSDVQLKASNSAGVIATGHMGLSVLILTVYIFRHYSVPRVIKYIMILLIILSTYVFLRSGSRGAILSAAIVLAVALLSVSKNKLKSIMWLSISYTILYLLGDYIIEWVGTISPVLVNRFEKKMDNGGQLNDRIDLYIWAWNKFKSNPIFGSAFGIYSYVFSDAGVSYSHNAFLDTLMQSGVLGGVLFIYLYVAAILAEIRLLVVKHPVAWVGLIMIQMMTKVMVSSAFYLTPSISIGMIIVLIADKQVKNKYKNGRNDNRVGFVRNTNL